jgi:hypothetical protein
MNGAIEMKLLTLSFLSALILSGCTATPNKDGSTTVKLNIPMLSQSAIQPQPNPQSAVTQSTTSKNTTIVTTLGTPIAQTNLAGVFSKHPWDGSAKSYFPKVAIIVTDFSHADCWLADAVIWWSATKSENVNNFSVCAHKSLGVAINGAAVLHTFMGQSQIFNHTGNLRTNGPKPPQFAISTSEQRPQGFVDFAQQLITETGWQAGPPEVSMWIVNFNKTSR